MDLGKEQAKDITARLQELQAEYKAAEAAGDTAPREVQLTFQLTPEELFLLKSAAMVLDLGGSPKSGAQLCLMAGASMTLQSIQEALMMQAMAELLGIDPSGASAGNDANPFALPALGGESGGPAGNAGSAGNVVN